MTNFNKWKSKALKKILWISSSFAIALGGILPNGSTIPVYAQIKADEDSYTIAKDTSGGDTWEGIDTVNNKKTHYYSGYDDDKKKALKVDASYGFELLKTKNTKVSVEKGKKCSAPSTYQGSDLKLPDFLEKYTWFNTADNSAGNIQIKISNLHIYQCNNDGSNGHWEDVDLVRTITGYEKFKGDDGVEDGYVALGAGITNSCYVGIEEMKVTSDFYKAGTSTKITLKSNVTLTDIDTKQYIGISAKQIDGQYVAANTKLSYKKDGSTNVYYADYNTNYDSEAFTAAGFIFEDSGFDYTFGRIRDDSPTNQEQYVGSGQNMVNFKPASPNKKVSDNDETDVTKNTVRDLGKSWTYSVEQPIASNIPENFYYDKFIMKDTIEECMKILDVKVEAVNKNAETLDVTSMFNISQSGNKVAATLKNPKDLAFYKNAIYTLKIKVKMDVPANATKEQLETLRKKWASHGHYNQSQTVLTEKNKAETVIDEYTLPTNEVSTEIHLSTTPDKEHPENEVPGLNVLKDVNRYEHQVGDRVKYTVTAKNTNSKADTAYFIIDDITLPDSMALDFDSVKISGIDAANYIIQQSGNGWILRSKGDYALPYGTTIKITYEATALVASNGTCVDNTATAVAAGIPEKKDSEQVYINSPKTDVVKKAPDRKYKIGDSVGYKVTITNRNPGTFMRNIVLNDLVKTSGLEIKEGSVAVMVGGKNVTNTLDITYQDDGKGFDIQTPYNLKNSMIPCIGLNPYNTITSWTDKIVVTYDATITDEAALESDLENIFKAPATENTNGDKIKDDETIPSGGGESTEDVQMKAPALDITKKSNKQTYEVGDVGKFTLVVKQTKEETTARNVVIPDTFAQEEGMKIDPDSIVVMMNGEDITAGCDILKTDRSFEIQTHKNMTDEDKIVVTYEVKFTKAGEYTNTAVAKADNAGEVQTDNVVDVVEAAPKLDIEKKSDKDSYQIGETGNYTVTVQQKNKEAAAMNVIIKDSFDQAEGFEIDADSFKVQMNGEDITEGCKILAETGRFRIETGRGMTSDDEIIVTYQVNFTKAGTYKNTAVTQADNADPVEDNNKVTVEEKTEEPATTEAPKTPDTTEAPKTTEKPSEPVGSSSVKTGQESILPVVIIGAAAVIIGGAAFMIWRKRKKKQ